MGPFTIRYERGNKANMIVRNVKSTEVLKFPVEKLALDLQGYNFTLDQTTYRIMSKFGMDVIEMLQEVERGGGPEAEWAKQSGGPFIITSKVGRGNDKYLVCDKGVILNYTQQIKNVWRTAHGPKVHFAGAQQQDRQDSSAAQAGGNRYQAFEEEDEVKVEDVEENSSDEEEERSTEEGAEEPEEDGNANGDGGGSNSSAEVVDLRGDDSSEERVDADGARTNKKAQRQGKAKKTQRRSERLRSKEATADSESKEAAPARAPAAPIKVVIELNQPEVHGYNTPDEGGSDSEDEFQQHGKTRKDFQPTTPATVSDASPLLSTPSTLSEILDPNEQAYILSITERIKANMEHSDRAKEATQLVLDTIQMEDTSAHYLPKLLKQGNVTLPALKSSKDKHYPQSGFHFNKYFTISNRYVLGQPAIDDATLKARLEAMAAKQEEQREGKKQKKQKKGQKPLGGAINLYITAKMKTSLTLANMEEIMMITNEILARPKGVRVQLKQLQCWESTPKQVLVGVNNVLCPDGVADTLSHHLKEIERTESKVNYLGYVCTLTR
jgi:hypothetical protein